MRSKKDILSVACSWLCMFHCMSLPVFAAASISSTGWFFFSESTHFWLNTLMILMAIWTFPNGWRTHKVTWPSLLALIGVGLMIMAAKVPESD